MDYYIVIHVERYDTRFEIGGSMISLSHRETAFF